MKRSLFSLMVLVMLIGSVVGTETLYRHEKSKTVDDLTLQVFDNHNQPLNDADCVASIYRSKDNAIMEDSKSFIALPASIGGYYHEMAYGIYEADKYFVIGTCYSTMYNRTFSAVNFDVVEDNSTTVSTTTPGESGLINSIKDFFFTLGYNVVLYLSDSPNADLIPYSLSKNGYTMIAGFLIPFTLIKKVTEIVVFIVEFSAVGGICLVVIYELIAIMLSFTISSPIDKIKNFLYYQILPFVVLWNITVSLINLQLSILSSLIEILLTILKLLLPLSLI